MLFYFHHSEFDHQQRCAHTHTHRFQRCCHCHQCTSGIIKIPLMFLVSHIFVQRSSCCTKNSNNKNNKKKLFIPTLQDTFFFPTNFVSVCLSCSLMSFTWDPSGLLLLLLVLLFSLLPFLIKLQKAAIVLADGVPFLFSVHDTTGGIGNRKKNEEKYP